MWLRRSEEQLVSQFIPKVFHWGWGWGQSSMQDTQVPAVSSWRSWLCGHDGTGLHIYVKPLKRKLSYTTTYFQLFGNSLKKSSYGCAGQVSTYSTFGHAVYFPIKKNRHGGIVGSVITSWDSRFNSELSDIVCKFSQWKCVCFLRFSSILPCNSLTQTINIYLGSTFNSRSTLSLTDFVELVRSVSPVCFSCLSTTM